ncbi:hypothetical protein SAMN05421771_0793 [Granulicella pectinivorans]|uniref:Uncharacterized protein n=1 Tax=Granulicella pectinivorans TaxID=474950 RepID=A0A1I6LJE3_9BACT|nr:hypothetical protein [Granulicella pectinivorans]SFS03605.1 hypothetical protein SAMN05421771_0793 [Granulicella pectinivorans]
MAVQRQLFPEPQRTVPGAPASAGLPSRVDETPGAPIWLQRVSLFVLVLFCIYLGVLVTVLPWWTRVWDHNMFLAARPTLAHILHNGYVRGIISGLGLLDIWIGISEAIHYRDYKD